MVVNEEDVVNIMGGMEHAGGIKLNDHKRKLKNRFEICRKLGQGTYGKVQLGVNKETGQQVAIKTIKKSKIETEADLVRIRREIQIMSSVQHPNIIHIYEVFENKEKMVLVMEIAAGGELYDYLSDRKSLEEKEARRIFRQIATAVYYCHKHNICHRDLKLENILLDQDGAAKIADFGLSNVFDRKNLLSTFCGSPLYASPEIVRGSPYQGPEVDCWSLGVLLYTLVYGAMPFDGSNFKRLVKQITTGDYYEPKQPSTASSLIRGMLTVKAEERANIVDICSHGWVNTGYKENCLDEAEYLASLTPVRLDLLLSLTRQENRQPPDEVKSEVATPTNKHTPSIDIEEIPAGVDIPEGVEECDVSLSEEPHDDKSPVPRRKTDHKRKLDERASLVEPEVVLKKQDNKASEDSLVVPPPPPPRVVPPEPMECPPDQVYERSKDRKLDSSGVIDAEKTPKVRRKNKSSGDVVVYSDIVVAPSKEKENRLVVLATPQSNRKQDDGRKTPKSQEGRKSRQSKSKTPDKSQHNKENNKSKFERPEPQPSPRPPREMFSPDLTDRSENLKIAPDQKVTPVKESTKQPSPVKLMETKMIAEPEPPPLPEKKRKSNVIARDVKSKDADTTVPNIPCQEPVEFDPNKLEVNKTSLIANCDLPNEKSENLLIADQIMEKAENLDGHHNKVKGQFCDVKQIESEPVKSKRQIDPHEEQQIIPSISSDVCKVSDKPNNSNFENASTSRNETIAVVNEKKSEIQSTEPLITKRDITPKKDLIAKEQKPSSVGKPDSCFNGDPKPFTIPLDQKLVPSENSNQLETMVPNSDVQTSHEKKESSINQIPAKKDLIESQRSCPIEEETLTPRDEKVSKSLSPIKIISAPAPTPPFQQIQNIEQKLSPMSSPSSQRNVNVSINNLPKLVVRQNSQNKSKEQVEQKIESSSPLSSPLKDKNDLKFAPTQVKSNESIQSMKLMKQDSPKSLINNIPKPFKPEAEKPKDFPAKQSVGEETKIHPEVEQKQEIAPSNEESTAVQKPIEVPKPAIKQVEVLQKVSQNGPVMSSTPIRDLEMKSDVASKSTDSVGSAISLSDDEKDAKPKSSTPSILPKQNGPNINLSTLSPNNSSNSLSPKKEKRDSKVIKAAAYWNNYIGEVTSKSRPPSNIKQMDKPKKIVSAGIGERGLKELTNAFEQGKPIVQEEKFTLMRRNSKKMNNEPCNPGLRVNDAKSVFEKKFQQPIETPRLTRRGSSTLDKPRFSSSKQEQDNESQQSPSPTTIQDGGKEFVLGKEEVQRISSKNNENVRPHMNTVPQVRTPKEARRKPTPSIPQEDYQSKQEKEDVNVAERSEEKTQAVQSSPIIKEEKIDDIKLTPSVSSNTNKDQLSPLKEQPVQAPVKPPTSPKPTLKRNDLGKSTATKPEDQKPKEAPKIQPAAPVTENLVQEDTKVIKSRDVSNIEEKPKEIVAEKIEPVVRPVRKEVTKIIFKNKPRSEEKKFNGFDNNNTKINNNTINVENSNKETEAPKLFIKTVKIKSPEPDKKETISSPEPNLSEIRSSLKKVPHSASNLSKNPNEPCPPEVCEPNGVIEKETLPLQADKNIVDKNIKDEQQNIQNVVEAPQQPINQASSPKKERIIPITFINENIIPKPFKSESEISERSLVDSNEPSSNKTEHHIPILVEGGARVRNDEDMERLDNFNANTISRRRWGSRKKRMSSAFSDSSMSDDDALGTPLSGLQKYTSYGKHGLSEQPLFRLKKTRPPFSVEKTDSFSSGEDDFDDDGFQEMTAENLFSTLLSRVKSLTRRIHDEHDEQINWQLTRHGPPKLNPGGTHARLERTAQRNSIKRSGDSARQYSGYDDSPTSRSPYDSSSSRYSSNYTPTKIYNRSSSINDPSEPRYSSSVSKRYDDNDAASDLTGSVSVTSSQRLRPGYLPPPANHNNPIVASSFINNTSLDVSDAQNLTPRPESNLERNIPINIQKNNLIDSPVHSKPGTPVPTPGVYMKHMKPFNLNTYENNDRLDSMGPGPSDLSSDSQRRVSRFLRPDFYDIPKEDSIYAKMKEIEDEDKRKPRFLRNVQSRGRETLSGRSTPLDVSSYSEEVPRSETRTPFGDSSALNEGLKYHQHQRPNLNSLHNHLQHKKLEDSGIEQDVLLAGVTKLRRQGLEHSAEVSEISDGYRTPDSESITSDVFGAPDMLSEGDDSFHERLAQTGLLNKGSIERKISRGSVAQEGAEDPMSSRYTSSRPVSRRSISRELFDLKYNNGRDLSKAVADYKRELTSPISRRYSRHSSNTDYTTPSTDRHSLVSDYRQGAITSPTAAAAADRTRSISQTRALGAISPTSSLSVQGGGGLQNDIFRRSPLTVGRLTEDNGLGSSYGAGAAGVASGSASLKDRNRQSWRRISVPERGKDFNTLPRKYNRMTSLPDGGSPSQNMSRPQHRPTLPPPSPMVRRSSTQESFRRPPGIRKSATLDYPDFSSGGGSGSSSFALGGFDTRERTPTRVLNSVGPSSTDLYTLPRDYSRGSMVGMRMGPSSRDTTPVQSAAHDMFVMPSRGGAGGGGGGSGGGIVGDPMHFGTTPREMSTAYGRRTPTYQMYNNRNSMAIPGLYREGSFSSTEAPNFSRYSSILDDKHDWGFSTLSRRNSRSFNGF